MFGILINTSKVPVLLYYRKYRFFSDLLLSALPVNACFDKDHMDVIDWTYINTPYVSEGFQL